MLPLSACFVLFCSACASWLSLQNLHILHFYNKKLTGSIPMISRLFMLQSLDLHNNFLAGSIPRAIKNLKWLHIVDMSDNDLIGLILDLIGKLSNQSIMFLNENHLSDSIPLTIDRLSSLGFLRL
ncbi:hypothetical protein SUGI_0206300 [Cryptomeria japonica]|nr:hypothetical protein SUGI_0206300 [Cryptomeria japonica]